VAKRQQLSSEISKAKREAGRATRDYGQEKRVIGRAREIAAELGVSPDVAEKLVLLLIESSLTVQERDQVVEGGSGDGKRALVIGGRGKMGGWFVRFLSSQGFAIDVSDPAGPVEGHGFVADWREDALDHD